MFRTAPRNQMRRKRWHTRHGGIVVWTAVTMTAVLGFVALAVDVGAMTLTKAQMQAAADGSALSAALEMRNGWGSGRTLTTGEVDEAGRDAAEAIATTYRLGEQAAAFLDSYRDVRFGQRTQSTHGEWIETWGASPYNMVEVTIHRDLPLSGSKATRADQELPLFFARVLGNKSVALTARATAAITPGNGFYIPPASGRTCPLLPLAIDETTWNNLINNGVGRDDYNYRCDGLITNVSDGIKEVSLYPDNNDSLPSGYRGSVDFGSRDNSAADLSRQIRYGCNEADLAYFGGKIQIPDSGLLTVNGDAGINAGIKDDLTAIIGQPRAIPVFRSVSGSGDNATYQICKFVGVRILNVNLTGIPSGRQVVVQPAPVFDGTIIGTPGAIQIDSIMTSLKLIH